MKKIIIPIIIIALIIIAAVRLMNNRAKNTTQQDNISVDQVTVSVKNVIKKNSSFTLEFTGTLYPYKELDIPAETQGKINSLSFQLGQFVNKGDAIATIDDKIKNLSYESAKIEYEKLKKDYERTENLFKGSTASEQELDNARTSYESAKIALDEAEKQLAYTRITSAIAGTIVSKNVEEGTYVNSGTTIASIVDISKLKVKLNASESDVYYLKSGNRVKMYTDIYNGIEFEGKITFISSSGDDSHNYPVEIELSNSTKYPLKAGTFVKVKVNITSDKDGLFIPRESLVGSIKDAQVYVAKDGKAKLINLLIGQTDDQYLEILSGLNESDKVIVSGQVNLTDNKSIKIINNN